MIIPQAPQPPSIVSNDMPVLQRQAEQRLGDDNLQHGLKDILLKHLVGVSIAQNEQQQVLTDVTITDMQSQRTLVGHNQDTEHFAASINKVPTALLVLEDLRAGKLRLDQQMQWQASDVRGGFGTFDQPGAPLQATLRDVLYDMLHNSGNTAVRVSVNKALGGSAAVNARWKAIGHLQHTYLIPLDADRFYLGNTSSRDALWGLTTLLKKSDNYSNFMKQALSTNIFTDMGTRSQLQGNDYIVLANKIGLLDDVDGNNRHDVGLIYNTKTHKTYGYSLLTTAAYNETDPSATLRADQSLKEMGGYTLRYAGDRPQQQPKAGDKGAATLRSLPAPEKRVLY
jgi:beta-lactamase class A